jgi:toxin ParE1/3/4
MALVFLARSARTDLLEIWSFISEESSFAADHVMDLIEKEAQTLALQPLMGRERPELSAGVRCWPTSSSYNLYYLPAQEGITIIRVLHQARDLQSRDFSSLV